MSITFTSVRVITWPTKDEPKDVHIINDCVSIARSSMFLEIETLKQRYTIRIKNIKKVELTV